MDATRCFRSLVISLAFVLAIIDLTHGFTLRNSRPQDLIAEESSFLEVRNDLKRSNDIKTTEKDEPKEILPLTIEEDHETVTKEDNETVKQNATVTTTTEKEVTKPTLGNTVQTNVTQNTTTVMFENNTNFTSSVISPLDWFETSVTPEIEKVINKTATSTVSHNMNIINETATSTVFNNINIINESAMSTVSNNMNIVNETATSTVPSNMNTMDEHIAQIKVIEFDNSVLELKDKMNFTTPLPVTEQETTTVIMTTDTIYRTEVPTTNEEKYITTEMGTIKSESITSIGTTTEAQIDSKTIIADLKTTPVWKKYSAITRKRVTDIEQFKTIPSNFTSTERIGDSVNAHTMESRVSLDKAFNLVPDIQSLQDLRTNLMDTTNIAQTRPDILETTNKIESQTESIQAITEVLGTKEAPFTATAGGNLVEMVSKRAGYLDHTKMAPNATANTLRGREQELDGVAYEIDLLENYGSEKKTSQSQLAEDAMKEELLKESLIHDKEVNSLRYRPTVGTKARSLDVITLKPSSTSHGIQESLASEQKIVDELSVKPISLEKKATNLYAVNPNYKPLKKIEVQPPKPFTRDPDDNSWRNESLNSLGIVFKAKNSTKAFTEVLKNKTETVMNSLPEQNRTIEKVELRERLEKIAEKRKRKKKIDQFGNTEYTDYEENNSSGDLPASKETPVDIIPLSTPMMSSTAKSKETTTKPVSTTSLVTNRHTFASTEIPKRVFNLQDYYDADDDNEDYVTLPNVDIMKSTTRPRVQWPVTQRILDSTTTQAFLPERKPTVQYFPPRSKPSPDVNVNDYDNDFKKKVNLYYKSPPQAATPTYSTLPTTDQTNKNKNYLSENLQNKNMNYVSNENRNRGPTSENVQYKSVDVNKNVYLTQSPKLGSAGPYESPETFNRGFIIRHYKDLIDSVIKDSDYDRNAYLFTEAPVTGVTANDVAKPSVKSDEYDYGQRKEVLDRFVDNFNQNHEQFKAEFPVLFNTSIVHNHVPESGKVLASSSAMFKRLYNDPTANKANGFLFSNKPYDPNCENITVELSPAYELHYYVPEQEEREEQVAITLPTYSYRL